MEISKLQRFFFKLNRFREKHLNRQQYLVILGGLVGLASGTVAVLMKNLTYFVQSLFFIESSSYYDHMYKIGLPIIGLVLVYVFKTRLIQSEIGQGISTTLYAISKRKGLFKYFQTYASLVAAPITVGFGGSAGLEAPTVVTSASLSTRFSRYLKLNQATKTLLIGCAAAGAMSSLFKAPIAAIIFAIEIFSLDLTLVSMIPLLVASVSAILTSYFFFGNDYLLQTQITDSFSFSDMPLYGILGVFTAFISIMFSRIYISIFSRFKQISSKLNRALVGGVCLLILMLLTPQIYGEGYALINELLAGKHFTATENYAFNQFENIWTVIVFLMLLLFLKILASSITIAAGGVGGIFAPVLFIGSIAGHCFGMIINQLKILNHDIALSNYTLVGMAGLMAGVMHAPLTAIFLIAELTSGYSLFIPLMITAAISYMITQRFQKHSVYHLELAQRGDLVTHNKDQAVLTLMEIEQVIETNFRILNESMTLGEVVKEGVIKSSRNIFPVVDHQQQFKGIILLDHIRTIMFDQDMYNKVKVYDLMQSAPDVIDLSSCKMSLIMQKFQQTEAWNLPVVKEGKYVGFISKSKLLTAYRQKLIEVTV
ncbi:MAG: chloride channel protein [Psychroflexus salarius]|jgi:CIC family chloride channel protein